MGKFSKALEHIMRGKRAAKRIKHPAGFEGFVMWCPLCTKEVMRGAKGVTVDTNEQQAAVDAHNRTCVRRKMGLIP